MSKKKPTLSNIVILGKFSDNKIRQIVCTEDQQMAVIRTLIHTDPHKTVNVIDTEMELISWESDVNLSKNIK